MIDFNLYRAKVIKNGINTLDGCLTRHFGNTRISVRSIMSLDTAKDDKRLRVSWWQTVSADNTATVGVLQHTDRTYKRHSFWNRHRT